MSAKTQKRAPQPKKRTGFIAVTRGLQSLTTRLGVLADLTGPKQAREWLILSLQETGQELGKIARKDGKPFSFSMISLWESGKRPLPSEIVWAYGELIASKLSSQLGRRIEIQIEVNSPWKVTAYRQCDCGQFFKMHDAKSKHCPRCRR